MHELSLCQAILEHVEARAGERAVRRVHVRIGYLRQVVPDSLLFSWEMLTESSDLAGCELVVEHVPAVVHCAACAAGHDPGLARAGLRPLREPRRGAAER